MAAGGDRRSRVAGLLALLALVACAPSRPEPPERIILIVVDTLRRDHLSPYGDAASTPTIGRLAARGQVFTNAVSSFHQTTMSMGALLTGHTPSIESGERGQPLPWTGRTFCGLARYAVDADAPGCVPQALDTLAEDLRDAGYWTIGVVANRLLFAPYGYEQGFEDWVEVGMPWPMGQGPTPPEAALERTAEHLNRAAIAALARRPRDRFFLYLHYIDVHDWGVVAPGKKRSYRAAVERLDRALGQLLDQLGSQGLLEDATVVLTSDHGDALGETHAIPGTASHYGNPSFDTVLRVPLIVSPPHFDATDRLVRSEDLPGLIMQIAGLHPESRSSLEPDELLVTEVRFQTYRAGRWKSIWPRDSDAAHLFDLEADPGETLDVAAAHEDILRRHRARVAELTSGLAATRGMPPDLSAEDRRRLRALGYLE